MLVLARKRGETIRINETITVSVVEIRGNRVRLGISTPREISICRSELLLRPTDEPVTVPSAAELSSAK